ncbi:MAG TPA: glycosyltransferase family 4 protein [Solirubrobacteraceae bacterium]|nr:glycosyltransferase family 4 protein [Solirubrobacteraceae bacterium]
MTTVLHVLPHAGGGAETYLDLLAGLDGYEQERVELSSARTPLAAAPSIARRWPALARRVRRTDLLHVHGDAAVLLTLPLLGRGASVWSTHGLHLLRRHPLVAGGVRAAIGRTRATICTSSAEARELGELAPRLSERLSVVLNGVAPAAPADPAVRAEVRAELGIEEGELAALFLGELEPRKGPLDALAAAAAARAGGAPLVLLVAGRGPLERAVAEQAGESIRALGFRDDPERLMAAADVFVLPSAREGLSFALLEAMAHGLAVVVADGPGNPEAVGSAGIVVGAGDREALAGALSELARDRDRRAALGAAARERVARELTPERLREGVRAAYERALDGPTAPGRAGAGARA